MLLKRCFYFQQVLLGQCNFTEKNGYYYIMKRDHENFPHIFLMIGIGQKSGIGSPEFRILSLV